MLGWNTGKGKKVPFNIEKFADVPVVRVNDNYYEDLDESHIKQTLNGYYIIGQQPKVKSGFKIGYQCKAPFSKEYRVRREKQNL